MAGGEGKPLQSLDVSTLLVRLAVPWKRVNTERPCSYCHPVVLHRPPRRSEMRCLPNIPKLLPHTMLPPSPAPPPVKIEEPVVLKALRSFPAGTAPGPSRLRASHLKEAVLCPSPSRGTSVLQAITDVINLLSSGCVPPEVIPHLCGANLLAVRKKSGGLRPIAVGEVLRRLTSKCISRVVNATARIALSPLQVGIGVPVGCEPIVLKSQVRDQNIRR